MREASRPYGWLRHLHSLAPCGLSRTRAGVHVIFELLSNSWQIMQVNALENPRATQPPIFLEKNLQQEQRGHSYNDRNQRIPAGPCNNDGDQSRQQTGILPRNVECPIMQ